MNVQTVISVGTGSLLKNTHRISVQQNANASDTVLPVNCDDRKQEEFSLFLVPCRFTI